MKKHPKKVPKATHTVCAGCHLDRLGLVLVNMNMKNYDIFTG